MQVFLDMPVGISLLFLFFAAIVCTKKKYTYRVNTRMSILKLILHKKKCLLTFFKTPY